MTNNLYGNVKSILISDCMAITNSQVWKLFVGIYEKHNSRYPREKSSVGIHRCKSLQESCLQAFTGINDYISIPSVGMFENTMSESLPRDTLKPSRLFRANAIVQDIQKLPRDTLKPSQPSRASATVQNTQKAPSRYPQAVKSPRLQSIYLIAIDALLKPSEALAIDALACPCN